ncbi:MAG: hypothetical protein JWR18_306 [Segetibacter sp.]|nr:hypothetical protein [Segetibacter sp.]
MLHDRLAVFIIRHKQGDLKFKIEYSPQILNCLYNGEKNIPLRQRLKVSNSSPPSI